MLATHYLKVPETIWNHFITLRYLSFLVLYSGGLGKKKDK